MPSNKNQTDTLPIEIFQQILTHLTNCNPTLEPNTFTKFPAPLCRVNRHWNKICTPWWFDSDPDTILDLWAFLLTIHNRPDLAQYVRYWFSRQAAASRTIRQRKIHRRGNALKRKKGLGPTDDKRIAWEWNTLVAQNHPRPLIAALVAHFPNFDTPTFACYARG
ncbi:hypothetical protein BDW69DRAFT_189931 [Aspergillus filifer]